jgi:molecular chaperone DnaJ
VRLQVTLRDVVFGATKTVELDTAKRCETCDGSGAAPGSHPETCEYCHGQGYVQQTVRSLLGNVLTETACPICKGYGTTIPQPCPDCAGQGRVRTRESLDVPVPAGIDNGVRLHLAGRGEVGPGVDRAATCTWRSTSSPTRRSPATATRCWRLWTCP